MTTAQSPRNLQPRVSSAQFVRSSSQSPARASPRREDHVQNPTGHPSPSYTPRIPTPTRPSSITSVRPQSSQSPASGGEQGMPSSVRDKPAPNPAGSSRHSNYPPSRTSPRLSSVPQTRPQSSQSPASGGEWEISMSRRDDSVQNPIETQRSAYYQQNCSVELAERSASQSTLSREEHRIPTSLNPMQPPSSNHPPPRRSKRTTKRSAVRCTSDVSESSDCGSDAPSYSSGSGRRRKSGRLDEMAARMHAELETFFF
ncbi:putative uncharacterized protein DDB_G0290521 [Macrosteles quadrilineatus]|uniref:putative uncharacterized protein DDB_G0290521 n=1 Tax=Macrosteles quadrilineatus TaxID=74068 RepID=UPI0023E2CCCA|nr:putative uncharacterized protein DDB_G0290521 [Macrosteles quadrilineatus]